MLSFNESVNNLIPQLLKRNFITKNTAEKFLNETKHRKIPLSTFLIREKILSGRKFAETCSEIFNLPIVDINNLEFEDIADFCNLDFIRQFRIIPLKKTATGLEVGIIDPSEQSAIDAITFKSGMCINLAVILEEQFEFFLKKFSTAHLNNYSLKNESENEVVFSVKEPVVTYDEPVVNFTNELIILAIQKSASDIHIEPFEYQCRIRFRQDGILYEITDIDFHLYKRLVTRIKVLAKLNISERRLPQDGRFQFTFNSLVIDIRINSCPTLFGEKIVLRLIDSSKITLGIDKLGFTQEQKEIFLEKISCSQGMVIVAGPTGSGKTTTLYSALNYLNTTSKNISTVEDPIEVQIKGINQVNINPKIGLNFSTLLRTFLRQDPDVIMVGEIRDLETANVAIQAAQTGHLVLSTVHANNSLDVISRLETLGIGRTQLENSISLIISQRLLRSLCAHCKIAEKSAASTYKRLVTQENVKLFRGFGCDHCGNGYQGRFAVFEFLCNKSLQEKALIYPSLEESAIQKVYEGLTSLAEIKRVLS